MLSAADAIRPESLWLPTTYAVEVPLPAEASAPID